MGSYCFPALVKLCLTELVKILLYAFVSRLHCRALRFDKLFTTSKLESVQFSFLVLGYAGDVFQSGVASFCVHLLYTSHVVFFDVHCPISHISKVQISIDATTDKAYEEFQAFTQYSEYFCSHPSSKAGGG